MDADTASNDTSSLLSFAGVVLACVCWVVVVVVFVPRLLGRLFAFVANRAARDAYHVSIPSLYIYPLAGRAVAHSVRYTMPNGTIAIEELVLICRWWRKARELQFRQLLTVDDPHTLDPVALEQQEMERENAAFFLKRLWYRLRRWWRRTAVTTDPNNAAEPRPLISLICGGLRARIVNDEKNYAHLRHVLNLAKASARRSAQFDRNAPESLEIPITSNELGTPSPSNLSGESDQTSSSRSSYSSVQSVDEKPFRQRMLELASLRISDGAFYFCDMGESPLVRLTVSHAKLRYRYGAPACPADECRKRIRMRVSGLSLSVASQDAVEAIAVTVSPVGPKQEMSTTDLSRETAENNTDRLIQRILSMGHRGISEPLLDMASLDNRGARGSRNRAPKRTRSIMPRLTQPYKDRQVAKVAKKSQVLPCSDILTSTTAVIDYVFDEPGYVGTAGTSSTRAIAGAKALDVSSAGEDQSALPSPECKLSVLLRGCSFSYDARAVADVETVMERLQPAFYDLRTLAKKAQTHDGRRTAKGMQIEIEATPPPPGKGKAKASSDIVPLIRIPFIPRQRSWSALVAMTVRIWETTPPDDGSVADTADRNDILPNSQVWIQASGVTLRTEVPYEIGVAQKSVLSMKDVVFSSKGVVDMRLGRSKNLSVTRVIHHPPYWNEELIASADVLLSDSEIIYVPDTVRIIEDLTATIQDLSKKPSSVRYFVPFKETTKIRAEGGYCVVVSSSLDNAWRDIYKGVADDYGRLKLCGEQAELALSPNVATEYFPDSTVLSWSLSLPNAIGQLEFFIPVDTAKPAKNRRATSNISGFPDSRSSMYQRGRTTSLKSRVRSHGDAFEDPHHSNQSDATKRLEHQVTIDFLRAGCICKLSGKATTNESRSFLDTGLHAFLDSVNRSDIHFKTSGIQLDINPHHMTSFLNMMRNYAGPGVHTLTVAEKGLLDKDRQLTARSILNDGRYPDSSECLLLGLAAGTALTSLQHRTSMDDILCLTFQIDSLLVRLHGLPHAFSSFDSLSEAVVSLESTKFAGSLRANRLGLDVRCAPESRRPIVTVHGGYLRGEGKEVDHQYDAASPNLVLPKLTVEDLTIHKRSWSSRNWGVYHSVLSISIGKVGGCLLDGTVVHVTQICAAALPDSLHEDTLAVAALLSVDNIEVNVGQGELLILSPSSAMSADRSGQMSRLLSPQRLEDRRISSAFSIPKFLVGVSQVRLPHGLRFIMSNHASASLASRSRLLLPDVAVDILMPWGGKLIPWVDNATAQAQVTHATALHHNMGYGPFQDGGPLRRVAEITAVTLDVAFDSRPCVWSARVPGLQKQHIKEQSRHTRKEELQWCFRDLGEASKKNPLPPPKLIVSDPWWVFLDRRSEASLMKNYLRDNLVSRHRFDGISVSLTSNAAVLVAPESLEIAHDVIVRAKELTERPLSQTRGRQEPDVYGDGNAEVSVSELLSLWRLYESSRPPGLMIADVEVPSLSIRAVETKGLRLVLASPAIPGELEDTESLVSSSALRDRLTVSVPFGIHFLHVSRTDSLKQKRVAHDEKEGFASSIASRMNIDHASVPSVAILCNDRKLCETSGIVFVRRQMAKVTNGQGALPEENLESREERRALVGRLASVRIGSVDSSHSTYACLGRVASIFLLTSRAVGLELGSLLRLRAERAELLCGTLFSSTVHDLLSGDADGIHCYFVNAIRAAQGRKDEDSTSTGAPPLGQTGLPSFNLRDHVADETTTTTVNSVDILLRNLSLTVADQDVVLADVFRCKGGESTGNGSGHLPLSGIVLNASVGTVCTVLRDDIAADALRMVSEVASFVRRAAFSMPMLRYDAHDYDGTDVKSSELLSFSYTNENMLQRKTNSIVNVTNISRNNRRRTRTGSQRLGTRRRRIAANRPSDSWGLRSLHPPWLRVKSDTAGRQTSVRHQLFPGWHSRPPNIRNTAISRPEIHLDDPSNLRKRETSEGSAFKKSRTDRTTTSGASRTVDQKDGTGKKTATMHKRLPTDRPVINLSDTGRGEPHHYAYVAIRTAGDSGPPRKRSKSMVRVTPLVPPAFSDSEEAKDNGAEISEFSYASHEVLKPRSKSNSQIEKRFRGQLPDEGTRQTHSQRNERIPSLQSKSESRPFSIRKKPASSPVTLFVSCHQIKSKYFRGKGLHHNPQDNAELQADLSLLIREPRLTFMSSPKKGSNSVVVTASSAKLQSANDPNCVLTGSISKIGVTMSLAQGYIPSTLPKLITSAQVSEFCTVLTATDLQSVLRFREEFKRDVKAVLSAFVTSKHSLSEMARATRLSSSRILYPGRTIYSTVSVDLLCEESMLRLKGFHPKDNEMAMTYMLDGMFFSVVASEDDNAALTLGLRLYGHGLSLAAPSWENTELLRFPSLDARGVQWGEGTGLPTTLKVTAEPLVNSTSIQGLRHVLFTVAGLMAFQNVSPDTMPTSDAVASRLPLLSEGAKANENARTSNPPASGTLFSRSFTAWERTKGVRMDVSVRPMALSLVSGQVVALFDVETITGIFEWNKLVVSGVQLHTAVSVPRISLSFMRMPSSQYTPSEIRPNERRTSLSIALERSRIDLLKTQEDLTHTFTFRIDVFAVSGQLRPWKLLLDAASWADEQELVADLQSINYASLSASRQRPQRLPPMTEILQPVEHRIILIGSNVQRFLLAVPLLSSEEYSSSRLALRATELHLLVRQRFDGLSVPRKNVMEIKTHFIGILWENSPLLSSHHARITLGVKRPTRGSTAHFGPMAVVMFPGTWRICPRTDVLMAILEAKNGRDNIRASEKTRELLAAQTDAMSRPSSSIAGDNTSNAPEKQARLLVESLHLKTLRTSGFIEGLDGEGSVSVEAQNRARLLTSESLRVSQTSKLSVPAFSIAMVRDIGESFDLIDIDFSGREGEFPRRCLGKVSNLFSDLFGVVNDGLWEVPSASVQHSREIARDLSVLVRFGRSLYRAQEDVNASMESKFGFFAGKSSSFLVSLKTEPVFDEETSHTTVTTGISPKLGLEITPIVDGAKVQSLRLVDARILHGTSPCQPPHTLIHINRVTALMEAKTLLLTQSRLQLYKLPTVNGSDIESSPRLPTAVTRANRNAVFVLGKPRVRVKSFEETNSTAKERRVEPDIRLQLKLPSKRDSEGDQVDLFVERFHIGVSQVRNRLGVRGLHLNVHTACHEVLLRARWDILSCKLRLRENLLCYGASEVLPSEGGLVLIANILNRLQVECMQYGKNTLKLDVDAIAAMWAVPKRDMLVESTTIHSEVAHTMRKVLTKVSGQMKKLNNEVKLLTERDRPKEARRAASPSLETRTLESTLTATASVLEGNGPVDLSGQKSPSSSSSSLSAVPPGDLRLTRPSKNMRIFIKGDELVVTMRGYQFDETQHSALVAVQRYDLSHRYSFSVENEMYRRALELDFAELKLSYSDEDRGINSELFRIPSPRLRMSIADSEDLSVELVGDLLVKLGHGFYYWQDFRKLSELTIMGIAHGPRESDEVKENVETPQTAQLWDGREPKINVRLNPRIDVIGDLTADMLQMMSARLGHVDVVPRQIYDQLVIPLETLSTVVCDPLDK